MSELNEEIKGDATQAQDINPEIKLEETNVSNGKIDDMPTTPSPSDASSFHSITNDVDPTITPNAIGKTKPIQDDTDKIEEGLYQITVTCATGTPNDSFRGFREALSPYG